MATCSHTATICSSHNDSCPTNCGAHDGTAISTCSSYNTCHALQSCSCNTGQKSCACNGNNCSCYEYNNCTCNTVCVADCKHNGIA